MFVHFGKGEGQILNLFLFSILFYTEYLRKTVCSGPARFLRSVIGGYLKYFKQISDCNMNSTIPLDLKSALIIFEFHWHSLKRSVEFYLIFQVRNSHLVLV